MRNTKGQFIKGHKDIAYNKGRIHTAKARKNMGSFVKGRIPWNKDTKNPLSKRNIRKGGNRKGENHPNWKGGISKLKTYRAFLESRRRALKRNSVGQFSYAEWEELKSRFRYMCLCCKKREPEIKLTIDHIVPLIKSGSNDISNIQPLCLSCNSQKSKKSINYIHSEDWLDLIKK